MRESIMRGVIGDAYLLGMQVVVRESVKRG